MAAMSRAIYAWVMNLELFSDAWARAWCAALNASDGYRSAARHWEGVVALVMTGDPDRPARAAVLDSAGGSCQAARAASVADLAEAGYVFEGSAAVWREVFTGRVAPAMALLTGKLKLSRGSLAALMPHAAAAREMLAAAATVPVEFPGSGEAS
jgi:putative sterol carrier protein